MVLHRRFLHRKRGRRDRGVVAGLLAILVIPLVVILISLGIDVTRTKYASSALRLRAEEICMDLSEQISTPRNAAIIFRERVRRLVTDQRIAGLKITGARLVVPTMSEQPLASIPAEDRPYSWSDGALPRKNACRDKTALYDAAPFSPGSGGVSDFHTIDLGTGSPLGNCSLDNGQDCEFVSDLCPGSATEDQNYPSGLWSNLEDAGAAAGCELEGEIARILSSNLISGLLPSRVVARAVWAAEPPRVRQFDPSLPVEWEDNNSALQDPNEEPNFPYKPLTIAVAPGLNTFSSADSTPSTDPFSFRYVNGAENVTYADIEGSEFRERYDPFLAPFLADGFGFGYASNNTLTQMTSVPALTAPERADFNRACMNPLVLVRNIFSSVIAEYASRHGLYRFHTESLVVPPVRDVDYYGYPDSIGNHPVMISEFGQDIANKTFQPPFLTFIRPGPGALNWNNPQSGVIESKFAGQLRNCYHLYANDIGEVSGARTGIQRYLDPGFMGGILENYNFEPGRYDRYQKLNTLTAGTQSWSQLGGALDWTVPSQSGSTNMTLGEVLGSLGSIRRCPAAGESSCPQDESSLPPDIYSLVHYLFKDANTDGTADPGAFALRSPGYWNAATSGGGTPSGPDFKRNVIPEPHHAIAPNRKSTVVIFTHYAPNANQVYDIQALINSEPPENRRIFKIIFIPPNWEARSEIYNLVNAFSIPSGPGATGAVTSEIFELSPESPDLQFIRPPVRDYAAMGASSREAYAAYWFDLLGYQYDSGGSTVPGNMYVAEMARKFFYQRLATPAVRY